MFDGVGWFSDEDISTNGAGSPAKFIYCFLFLKQSLGVLVCGLNACGGNGRFSNLTAGNNLIARLTLRIRREGPPGCRHFTLIRQML